MSRVTDPTSSGQFALKSDGTKRTMNFRLGVALFVIAYISLVPGLVATFFSYDFLGKSTAKSTIGTIGLLLDEGSVAAALILAFFALVVPTMKLVLWGAASHFAMPRLMHFVQYISKWAIVDAITVSVLMSYIYQAAPTLVMTHIHSGFYFFVGYCLLSTAGAVLVHESSDPISGALWVPARMRLPLAIASNVAAITLAVVTIFIPFAVMSLNPFGTSLLATTRVSLASTLCSLATGPLVGPFVLVLLMVVVMPLVEHLSWLALCVHARGRVLKVAGFIVRYNRYWGMWDVCAVTVLVMSLAINGIKEFDYQLLGGGFTAWIVTMLMMIIARVAGDQYLSGLDSIESIGPLESESSTSEGSCVVV